MKNEILTILNKIKGTGKYCTSFSNDFIFPNMEIKGIGEIAFPINDLMAKHIIGIAHKAHFGKGSKTILDNTIRSTWEIDAPNILFNSNNWKNFIEQQIEKIKKDLGIENKSVKAILYKLLVYETGDFFLPHKDSEKEKGMFGTMIVTLPSKYKGGELVVNFEEESTVITFENTDNRINVAAFYADCEHELKPITSGNRVCLIYNLVFENENENVSLESFTDFINEMKICFEKMDVTNSYTPIIITLDHQYTPENFVVENLKLNDCYKVKILHEAAKELGIYAKPCLVTAQIMGSPVYDGYSEDDEDAEIDEVYDEDYYIEHWAKNDYPNYGHIVFDKENLITNLIIEEDEPFEKENSGYMGNYGPDITHWYHYAAVYIMSKKAHIETLRNQNNATQLNWINYYSTQNNIDADEIAYVYEKLNTGFKSEHNNHNEKLEYMAIVSWIINKKDIAFFDLLNNLIAEEYFQNIDTKKLAELIHFLPQNKTTTFIDKALLQPNAKTIKQLLELIYYFSNENKHDSLMLNYFLQLPTYLSHLFNSKDNNIPLNANTINQLITIENQNTSTAQWQLEILEILVSNKSRKYFNDVLISTILTLKNQTQFSASILKNSYDYFTQISTQKPQPPEDWAMQIPKETHHKNILKNIELFLTDPNQNQFDFRKNQAERDELDNAIRFSKMDLKTETIKKGSPHILRITKTQATYELKLKNWNNDMRQFEHIKSILNYS